MGQTTEEQEAAAEKSLSFKYAKTYRKKKKGVKGKMTISANGKVDFNPLVSMSADMHHVSIKLGGEVTASMFAGVKATVKWTKKKVFKKVSCKPAGCAGPFCLVVCSGFLGQLKVTANGMGYANANVKAKYSVQGGANVKFNGPKIQPTITHSGLKNIIREKTIKYGGRIGATISLRLGPVLSLFVSPVPVPITFNPYFQAELGAEVSYHGTALVENSISSVKGTDMVHENALITNDNPTASVQDSSVLLQTN